MVCYLFSSYILRFFMDIFGFPGKNSLDNPEVMLETTASLGTLMLKDV